MKGYKIMSDNLEIVMDIDTLEIFEVIDLDNASESENLISKDVTREIKIFNSETYFESRFRQTLLFRSLLKSCSDYSNQLFYDSS